MGVAASGARDIGNFVTNISNRQIPSITSITYEGAYNEHFFYTGSETEKILSCTYSTLISRDPFSNQTEYYMTVGLNSKYDGSGIKEFKRPPLNLVVCIDVSGSMGNTFHYKIDRRSKMEVAIESLKILVNQLRPEDSFSLISFSTEAKMLIPLTKMENANKTQVTDYKFHLGFLFILII